MKIVLIASDAASLINFREALLSALVDQGHDVVAFAPGKDEEVTKKLNAIGVKYYQFYLQRAGINPIKDIYSIINLFVLLHRLNPDAVISYTIKPVLYGSFAAWLANIPRVFSMITGVGYAYTGRGIKRRILGALISAIYPSILKTNKLVFFQNKDDQSLFIRKGFLKEADRSVVINGSGVDLVKFSFTPITKHSVFLLIARLLRDKGIFEFIEAARILKKRYPEAIFRIVGPFDDNPSAISKNTVRLWVDENIVEYLGETKDVRPFIIDSSVFVLPSYREGTPRTVLEAMAMGRPVITTEAPGCRETVVEGRNGFLVPVKDVGSLVEAMEKFILHPELIDKMGKKSREIAENKYNVHHVNAVIINKAGLSNEANA